MRRFCLMLEVMVIICLYSQMALGDSNSLFPLPAELKADVHFWSNVYTQVDTNEGYIHDNRFLNVVYETVRFDPNQSTKSRNRYLKKRKQQYREILKSLSRGTRTNLDEEQQRVLALWPTDVSNKTLRDATNRLRFQLGQSDKFRAGLVRSGRWRNYIENVFQQMGLPVELSILPHVESSFNPGARSHVGAAGMWQFTRATGRRFLRVDHIVDDRLDPYKSTVAAARLLAHNYSVTKTWPLALTAYNHGVSGMRRATKRLGTTDIDTIARRYKSRTFGFASRNFYVAFLAALRVDKNPKKYFGDIDLDVFVPDQTVAVNDFIPVDILAQLLGIKKSAMRKHNQALQPVVWNGDKYIPKGYLLRLPAGVTKSQLTAAITKVPVEHKYIAQVPDVNYTVRRGNTLSQIASRYDVSVKELMSLNQLRSRHRIRVGQILRLPTQSKVSSKPVQIAQAEFSKTVSDIPGKGLYKVRRGDTIGKIAARYGLAEKTLLALNTLPSKHRIYVGQQLRLQKVAVAEDALYRQVAIAPELEVAAQITEMEQAESAEPVSNEDSESMAPTTLAAAHAAMSADPSDYSVADDLTIEIQASETLGHYAEWLNTRARELRKLNHLKFGRALVIGKRLRMPFDKATRENFEQKRLAYHSALQEGFFEFFQITGTKVHEVKLRDSLWVLAQKTYKVPIWLLRQYNPDLDLNKVHPGALINFPNVAARR